MGEASIDPRSVLHALPDPVVVLSPDGFLRYANPAADRSLRRAVSAEVGLSMADMVHPDDLQFALEALVNLQHMEVGRLAQVRVRTGDGGWTYWEVRGIDRIDHPGVDGYVVCARDVTDRGALDLGSGDDALIAAAVHLSSGLFGIVDAQGTVVSINRAVTRLLGHHPGNVIGQPVRLLTLESDYERLSELFRSLRPGVPLTTEVTVLHADGSEVPLDATFTDLRDDPLIKGVLMSGQPAFNLRAARERAEYLARHDPLTGLLNRAGFFHEAMALAPGPTDLVGVLVLDLDRFTAINDLLGEDIGDEVLATVARRLQRAVRRSDLVARHGGDQFLIASVADAPPVFDHVRLRVEQALAEPVCVGEHELRLSCTFGTATAPAGTTIEWLVSDADTHLNDARRRRTDPSVPVGTMTGERRALIDELTRAIDHDELRCWYQPVLDGERRVVGYEALLRWEHPTRGVVGPGAFLPLMAFAGMDHRVDAIVLDQAVRHTARVRTQLPDAVVHINVTPRQIARPSFVAELTALVRQHGVAPDALCLEITETDLLRIERTAVEALVSVRRRGFRVAIDDFGTGYSSLSHLLELPIDTLKIDRRFIGGLGVDPTATGLVAAIVTLAASLGLTCVAEGVETEAQHDELARLGCPLEQGWLHAPALPADESLAYAHRTRV